MVLSKEKFIEEQSQKNLVLFDFAQKLDNSIIEKIEIIAGSVIISFANTGIKMYLRPGDKRIPQSEALNFGEYENKEINMVLSLAQNCKNIYDVGANCGWFSLELAARFPNATIHAFEPVQDLFHDLKQNLDLNKFENIKTFQFGFSNQNTKAQIYYDPMNSAHTSLASTIDSHCDEKLTDIDLKTLDSFATAETKPDFIKIDVEGAELLVLQGAHSLIHKHQPIFFLEMVRKWTKHFNYHPNDLIHYLNEYDYSCYKILENNKLKLYPHMSEEDLESNFVFLQNTKHRDLIAKFSV